jgi:hypothetical protein
MQLIGGRYERPVRDFVPLFVERASRRELSQMAVLAVG